MSHPSPQQLQKVAEQLAIDVSRELHKEAILPALIPLLARGGALAATHGPRLWQAARGLFSAGRAAKGVVGAGQAATRAAPVANGFKGLGMSMPSTMSAPAPALKRVAPPAGWRL